MYADVKGVLDHVHRRDTTGEGDGRLDHLEQARTPRRLRTPISWRQALMALMDGRRAAPQNPHSTLDSHETLAELMPQRQLTCVPPARRSRCTA